MAMSTQPTLSSGKSARIVEAAALSPSSFCKRYRSSYETSSSSPPALPIRKRYRGTSELVKDTKDESLDSDTEREGLEGEGHSSEGEGHSSEDEGPGLEDEGLGTKEEEVAPEGQQQAVSVVDTATDEPLGLGYGALRRRELALGEGSVPITFEIGQSSRSVPEHEGAERISAFRQPTLVTWAPLSPEWSSGSLPVSPSPPIVPSPIASLVTTLAATISHLDVLPPTLFEVYDRNLKELYTRSGAVRDEIFSQRYRFRNLEREQERATVTFNAIWRPTLALEAWADRVARMERRQESRGE
ncbi:hypothetical protein Tco_1202857 [Tanacetum coccineum]